MFTCYFFSCSPVRSAIWEALKPLSRVWQTKERKWSPMQHVPWPTWGRMKDWGQMPKQRVSCLDSSNHLDLSKFSFVFFSFYKKMNLRGALSFLYTLTYQATLVFKGKRWYTLATFQKSIFNLEFKTLSSSSNHMYTDDDSLKIIINVTLFHNYRNGSKLCDIFNTTIFWGSIWKNRGQFSQNYYFKISYVYVGSRHRQPLCHR